MKPTILASKYNLTLTEIRHQLTQKFKVSTHMEFLLERYFTRVYHSSYVHSLLSGGQITYENVHYNVIWKHCGPAYRGDLFLSFRKPIIGLESLPYVIIVPKLKSETELEN